MDDIVERLREDAESMFKNYDLPKEAAEEIERLREALRLMPKTITDAANEIERLREAAKDRPKDRPNEAANEIDRLRKALTDLDRGINQWVTTYSAIKKTLLKIIADALKEDE